MQGDAWHHLSAMAFKVHPYNWPTIGKVPQHIEEALLSDVKDFYAKYYRPNNAVLSIAGNVDAEKLKPLIEKWFGDIPAGEIPPRRLPSEPTQQCCEVKTVEANVPVDAVYLAFHIPGRLHPDYYAVDLLSDILCNGNSSRLYRRLLKQQQLFTDIDCYVSGSIDPGLLVVEGKPAEGISHAAARTALWAELEDLKANAVAPEELEKVINKVESTLVFSESNVLNKAMNLAFYELLGDAELVNKEVEHYGKVTTTDIQRVANDWLHEDNCCELYYTAKPTEDSDTEQEEMSNITV